MKKTLFAILIGLILAGYVSAQQGWGHQWGRNSDYASQSVSITGTLELQNGVIAVVTNSQVYYVPNLERLVGFIDGLKEGAQVSVDGYVWNNYGSSYIQPAKLTINGKSYDLLANTFAMGTHRGYGRQGAWGHDGWCH